MLSVQYLPSNFEYILCCLYSRLSRRDTAGGSYFALKMICILKYFSNLYKCCAFIEMRINFIKFKSNLIAWYFFSFPLLRKQYYRKGIVMHKNIFCSFLYSDRACFLSICSSIVWSCEGKYLRNVSNKFHKKIHRGV